MKISSIIVIAIFVIPYSAFAESQITFELPSGIEIEIIEEQFLTSNYRVEGCGKNDNTCLIDGKMPYGTAFGLPKTYLKKLTATYQGQSHELDTSNMYNAWGKRPIEYEGGIRYFGGNCYDKDNCQFRGLFSDAAGSYVAEWKIIYGKSYRTVLTTSDDIVRLFMQNIDPPIYE